MDRIFEVAVGLILIFAITAGLASILAELGARLTQQRAAFLLSGIRALVDGNDSDQSKIVIKEAEKVYKRFVDVIRPATPAQNKTLDDSDHPSDALFGGPLLNKKNTAYDLSKEGKVPSYIASGIFSAAIVDLLIPDGKGQTTLVELAAAVAKMDSKTCGPFKDSISALLKSSGDSIDDFRKQVEAWYDEHMERVSGQYKRRIGWITFFIGLVLVAVFNINAVTIARTLYVDAEIRAAVSAIAKNSDSACIPPETASVNFDASNAETCLNELRNVGAAGLPIGWSVTPECSKEVTGTKAECNFWQKFGFPDPSKGTAQSWSLVATLLGYILTVIALTPGARFYYDLLNLVAPNSQRSSGPKPKITGQPG